MTRILEGLGVLGGSAGLIYGIGFFIAAAHYRVLGLPIRSVEPAMLLANASEFLIQGTLFSAVRAVQAASGRWVSVSAVLATGLAVALLWWRRHTWAGERWARILEAGASRHRHRVIVLSAVLILAVQAYHATAHVIPAGALTGLLTNPNPAVPPFPPLRPSWQQFFDDQFDEVRTAIVGNGQQSDTATLTRLYVVHFSVAVTTLGVGLWLWLLARRRSDGPGVRHSALAAAAIGALLLLYTPSYYGITMKSYRFPKVTLSGVVNDENRELLIEFRLTRERPRFLLHANDQEYVLYEPRFGEVQVIRRELIGVMKVAALSEFLFQE
jgi:hypothetical protein